MLSYCICIPVALCTKKQRVFSQAGPHFYTAKVSGAPGPKCIWEQDTAPSPVSCQVFLMDLCLQIPQAPAGSPLASSSAENPRVSPRSCTHPFLKVRDNHRLGHKGMGSLITAVLPISVILIAVLTNYQGSSPNTCD